MNIQLRIPRQMIHLLFSAALIAAPALLPAEAKDTDIYLKAPASSTDDKPNVLIILDNSGSMSEIIPNSIPEYDPTVDYCDSAAVNAIVSGAASGIPSNCADMKTRTYWMFGDTPPDSDSNQWFASTKNECLDSLDPASGLSTSGIYKGGKIARWYGSGTRASRKNWKTLDGWTDARITYVDCEADGTADGQTAGDNTFPKDTNDSPAYTSTSGDAFDWDGFTTDAEPTLYAGNYMAYWHNSNLRKDRSRMELSKSAVKSLIDSYKNVRFGLMVFNSNGSSGPHGGRVVFRVANMDNTRRAAMKTVVSNLTPGGATPLSETLWEAYRYLAGLGVTYGNPDPAQTPHQDSCAQNTTNIACNNGGYYDAIAASDADYNDGTYITPYTYGCQSSYIIYITDGDPTRDTDADDSIKTLNGGTACTGNCLDELAGYMQTHDINSLPDNQVVQTYTIALGTDISEAGKTLLSDTAKAGSGKYLTAVDGAELQTALQTALNDIGESNTSFTAPSLSVNAFNRLYNRDDIYFALFTPSNTQAWDGNLKKYKLCNSSDVTEHKCTYGEIIDVNNKSAIDTSIDTATGRPKNKIKDENSTGGAAASYWDDVADGPVVTVGGAGAQIAVPRKLYTYLGDYADLTPGNNVVEINTDSTNTVYIAAAADPTILGLPATAIPTADSDKVAQLINWMRGQDAYDDNNETGHTDCLDSLDLTDPDNFSETCLTESRRWNFADPLHSRPVAFTYGCEDDTPCTASSTPVIKLFVGTNDGMVRMINNSTGKEEWAFAPKEMLEKQYTLYANSAGDHIYGLDDSPAFLVNDIDKDGVIEPTDGDKVYMYIGMRRGGKNIYAFDVTPSSTMDAQTDTVAPKLLWAIEGGSGDFAQLGQTWSRPKIARIRAKCTGSVCDDGNDTTDDSESRMVLIFGGGYNTSQDNDNPGTDSMGNAIYIVDPFTGARIWWASNDAGADLVLDKMEFSIPSEVMAIDTNADKSVDRLYVGDTGGQLWRIDLGNQIGAASDGSSGYVFADVGCDSGATQRLHNAAGACPGGTTDQGERKFFYPPDVAMVKDGNYSSSEYYDLVTIGSGNREDPLDLLTSTPTADYPVLNRIYAFRDYNYKTGAPSSSQTPLSEYNMYDATANKLGTLTGDERQTEIDDNVKDRKGWYIDLKETSAVTLMNGLSSTSAGEKVLAKTVVFDSVLHFTTYVPANKSVETDACEPNEGTARAYAVNYLTGEPAYDQNDDGSLDRYADIGGGIPSEVVVVIRDGGVTALVGTSGGAAGVNVSNNLQRYKTYWWDE